MCTASSRARVRNGSPEVADCRVEFTGRQQDQPYGRDSSAFHPIDLLAKKAGQDVNRGALLNMNDPLQRV